MMYIHQGAREEDTAVLRLRGNKTWRDYSRELIASFARREDILLSQVQSTQKQQIGGIGIISD
jgi:hypothetical protein